MKILFILSTFLLCPLLAFFQPLAVSTHQAGFEPIAVIELFSSQGCSSCPPADRLLSKTIAEAGKTKQSVFALSFHVDYWDRLGWKDPFSNAKFSARQNEYSEKMKLRSNYTPQMIVNGSVEFVGSDNARLEKALNHYLAIKAEAAFKKLEVSYNEKNIPTLHYELEGNFSDSNINLALLSITEKTPVKRGENSGLTIINDHVVSQFISQNAVSKGEVHFNTSPLPARQNTTFIAYIQNKNTFKITGAAQVTVSNWPSIKTNK